MSREDKLEEALTDCMAVLESLQTERTGWAREIAEALDHARVALKPEPGRCWACGAAEGSPHTKTCPHRYTE